MTNKASGEYYVYIYRDPRNRQVRYIGKGVGARVEKHLKGSHNDQFSEWLAALEGKGLAPLVEHFPCTDEDQAYAVEAALISMHWSNPKTRNGAGIFNKVRGHHRHFTPLGLPPELGQRQHQPALNREDIAAIGGALVVIIGITDFINDFDHRRGAKPRLRLPESDVRDRIVGWWQIGVHLEAWNSGEAPHPARIIGVTGPVSRRWVWGSIRVPKQAWEQAEVGPNKLHRIPVTHTEVDDRKLRGRLVREGDFGPLGTPERRHFGSFSSQFFDVVPPA
ncbi:GIY-YIG nuclease family protein [Streptomyces sp. NPDC001661]